MSDDDMDAKRPIGRPVVPPEDRIAGVILVGEMHCWKLKLKLKDSGYLQFRVNGRRVYAHRVSYELFIGEIPKGFPLDHLCRNRWCLHPNHVLPVTTKENVLRGDGITARSARRSTCIKGHELTYENTYHYPSARGRICRICAIAYLRKRRKDAREQR